MESHWSNYQDTQRTPQSVNPQQSQQQPHKLSSPILAILHIPPIDILDSPSIPITNTPSASFKSIFTSLNTNGNNSIDKPSTPNSLYPIQTSANHSPISRIISPPRLSTPISTQASILLSPIRPSFHSNHNAIISGMNDMRVNDDDHGGDDNYHHVKNVLETIDSEHHGMGLFFDNPNSHSFGSKNSSSNGIGNNSLGNGVNSVLTMNTPETSNANVLSSPVNTPKPNKSLKIRTATDTFRKEYPKSARDGPYVNPIDTFDHWQQRQHMNGLVNPYTKEYQEQLQSQKPYEQLAYTNNYDYFPQNFKSQQQQYPHSTIASFPPHPFPTSINTYNNSNKNNLSNYHQGPKSAGLPENKKPFERNSPQKSIFLEDFRISKRKYELSDIAGHVIEFCTDQHGSRFIQQKLEQANYHQINALYEEIAQESHVLMSDVFGNYVIQKLFEFGDPQVRNGLCMMMRGKMRVLSMGMYGCRVVQKALEYVDRGHQHNLVEELKGHVLECVKDQNGNHVIQKAIECCDPQDVAFFIDAFHNNVYLLATHPYGCRVIQRVFENLPKHDCDVLLGELVEGCMSLIQDQYGNYVIQHILEKGTQLEKQCIIKTVRPHLVQMSKHKYASNVIEKCVHYTTSEDRSGILEEVCFVREDGVSILSLMMKDPFANYVVQRLLDCVNGEERARLLEKIRPHLGTLRKFTYGKHLIAKVEKFLCITAGTIPLGEEYYGT